MRIGIGVICAMTSAALAQGCCGATSPVSLKTGIRTLERDVQETTPITLSDLDPMVVAAWTKRFPQGPPAKPKDLEDLSPHDRVVELIKWGQCQSNSANPLIPVVSGAFSLALQGSFQWGGSAGGSDASTGPSGTLGVTFTVNKQQGVTVPITFVTASNIGTFYMSQMMAFFANTTALSTWAPPSARSWPVPAVLPQAPATPGPGSPPTIPFSQIASPPAPGSQLARAQAAIDRILQTRDAIDTAAKDAVEAFPPAKDFCKEFAKSGVVAVAFPTIE